MAAPTHDDLNLGTWRRDQGTVLRQAVSVPAGGRAPQAIIAESEVTRVPTEWSPHSHPMHELVWVRSGTLTSRVGNRIFTVPPGFGLWLPAGVVHGGRLTAAAQFHDAFFAPDRTPVEFAGPTPIEMTSLLESLLVRLARPDLDAGARAR
ncbi:cupin domain-containing protein [Actinoplanes sp. NPDC026619]|uniref:cupin domain-containing protein n=1 Tax=Actinoplanes sp. NPDC026619 TaxID=3155798 RepID=UPI0033C91562